MGWRPAALLPFLLAFLLLLLPRPSLADSASGDFRHVLLLSSYHAGFVWDDKIKQALDDVLKPVENRLEVHYEYMDSKRLADTTYVGLLRQLYGHKYQTRQPALIIASDNFAFDFLRQYGDELFPRVPVVFCGVNFFQEEMLNGHPLFTGAAEVFDAVGTLDIIMQLHPGTREIFVLNDHDLTGRAWADSIRQQVEGRHPGLSITYADSLTAAGAIAKVGSLAPGTVVLLGVFLRDAAGEYISAPHFGELLAQASVVPIYGLLDLYLGHGIVGGLLIDGYHQGKLAAQIALRILAGEPAGSIPVLKTGGTAPLFDYRQLRRFAIPEAALPSGSTVIHKPVSFYAQHAGKLVAGLVFVLAESLLIFFLALTVMRQRTTERALRQSEAILAATGRMARVGGWELNVAAGAVTWTEEVYRIHELDLDHRPTMDSGMAFYAPQARPRVTQAVQRAIAVGEPFDLEAPFVTAKGNQRWVRILGKAIRQDGRTVRVVGTFQDITDRKEIELALELSEVRFRELFDNMSSAVVVCEAQDGGLDFFLTNINKAGQRLGGVGKEEVVGRSLLSLFPQAVELGVLHALGRVWQSGVTEFLPLAISQEGGPAQYFEGYIYRLPSGEVVAVYDEVSERKRAEEMIRAAYAELEERVRERTVELSSVNAALLEAKVLLEKTFASLSDAIVVVNPVDRRIEACNQAVETIFGYRPEEVLGRNTEFLHLDRQAYECFAPMYLAQLREQGVCRFEYRFRHRDGHAFDAEITISAIAADSGQLAGLVSTVRDITERKRLEEELRELNRSLSDTVREEVEKNRAKDRLLHVQNRHAALGEMISHIAHQWRQPLNTLALIVQGVEMEFSEGRMEVATMAAKSARAMEVIRYMSQTIDDFRNFFRQDKEITRFSVREAVRKALGFLGTSLELHGIAVRVEIAEDITITGFQNEFTQVLVNLFGNAKDVLEEGAVAGPLLTVRAFREGEGVVVTVQDNGGGIPADIVERVFDPYFTTKAQGQGTGLGLYMSKTIIEKNMRGTLTVSNVDGGAMFRIEVKDAD